MTELIAITHNKRKTLLPELTPTLLIADRNVALLQDLAPAMQMRGFKVVVTQSAVEAIALIDQGAPAFALVGMRFDDGSGLEIVSALLRRRPEARAVIQTSYGNLKTAVRAVKIGAVDFLTKPADPDDVVSALLAPTSGKVEPPQRPMSAERVRWEHIQSIHEQCGGNVSATVRRLGMHRRTLQRILAKRPPQ